MSLLLVAALLLIVIAAISLFRSRTRDGARPDSVSERWLAERRATDPHRSDG
jgi:hypothetical protein